MASTMTSCPSTPALPTTSTAAVCGQTGDTVIVNAERSASSSEASRGAAEAGSYQELPRFCTWRKHVKDLYQTLFYVDLIWESPVAQLMPYVTVKGGLTTHTVISGTRTNGQEQNYLQLLSVTVPYNAGTLDSGGNAVTPFCEATGEVGGFGMAPHQSGLKVERRIVHNGDVLTARYMPANPLLLASSSSDGQLYVFDWSRVSLNRFPNDPPRPRAPLPPNELTEHASDEERSYYHKRMRELNAVTAEQDRWDRRTGDGQHILTLHGGCGVSDNVDWSTTLTGTIASGSHGGRLCVWDVAALPKEASRSVSPTRTLAAVEGAGGGEESDSAALYLTSVKFSWQTPQMLVCGGSDGVVRGCDVRAARAMSVLTRVADDEVTAVAPSPLDANALLVGTGSGRVMVYDMRRSAAPMHTPVEPLHSASSEVTVMEWCPHSRHLFATGGSDGDSCIYNATRGKLLFRHAGHTEGIMDLCWNWQETGAGQLLTTDSNALMLWRPRDYFFVT